ncbi:hypothetical protein AAT19DRAFT_11467 [Rhodotorula toruloides]|uniref:Uncharacterized protein n=1 Tax=Rhodotorula toruloides TaxID=5286 RepID=A0A2S9ZWV6_RHOTO|nr:hypothetical protein AAT19DRAFT_11467 [Rhodotorula toruloides]
MNRVCFVRFPDETLPPRMHRQRGEDEGVGHQRAPPLDLLPCTRFHSTPHGACDRPLGWLSRAFSRLSAGHQRFLRRRRRAGGLKGPGLEEAQDRRRRRGNGERGRGQAEEVVLFDFAARHGRPDLQLPRPGDGPRARPDEQDDSLDPVPQGCRARLDRSKEECRRRRPDGRASRAKSCVLAAGQGLPGLRLLDF